MLTLYHDWDSLMSFKVRACLEEKDLEWQGERVVLRNFDHLQPNYLEINPNGVVPTLVHDDQVIVESSVINEYLDEVFPQAKLMPETAKDRARIRSWVKYGDDVIHHSVRPATFNLMIRQGLKNLSPEQMDERIRNHPIPARADAFRKLAAGDIDIEAVNNAIKQMKAIISRMELSLSNGPWLAGEEFSLADIATMPFVDRLEHLKFSQLWQGNPKTQDWVYRIKSRASFLRAAPSDNQRLPPPETDELQRLSF